MRVLVAFAAAALALAGCAATPAPPSAERVTALPQDADLLFVARAAEGDLAPSGGTATLTLSPISTVSWFTDRPARQAGLATLEDALTSLGWNSADGSLGSDAPNAELTADELGAESLALELRSATVDGSTVTFTVSGLGGASIPATALSSVELFIDDSDITQTVPVTIYGSATTVVDGDAATVTISLNGEVVYTVTLTPQSTSDSIDVAHLRGAIMYFPAASGGTSSVDATLLLMPDDDEPRTGHRFAGQLASWTAP